MGLDYTTKGFWNHTIEYIYDKRGLSKGEWGSLVNLISYHESNAMALPQEAVDNNLKI